MNLTSRNITKSSLGRIVILAVLLVATPLFAGSRYKVLHAFGKAGDGGGLWSPVTLDKQGSLWGATSGGGGFGQGIVFKLTPLPDGSWKETIVHSFPSQLHDGQGPNGGLIQDSLGKWYGTTAGGGTHPTAGTIFELSERPSGWKETILYNFGTYKNGGGGPHAAVVMDGQGNLYGTAGVAYELQRSSGGWQEIVLHDFTGKNGDGSGPYAGLILGTSGNLYGTTEGGGAYNGGTVYELLPTASGWSEKLLHSFAVNYRDGHTPGWGALFMDGHGGLYGTTAGGGCCGGVIFRLTPEADGKWKEIVLYEFKGGSLGFEAGAGVVMDKAGNLYGTTIYGGSTNCGCGTVYKLAPGPNGKWTYRVLHTFIGSDGAQPDANLILDDQGNLYGTTATGGAYGSGVVFELTP